MPLVQRLRVGLPAQTSSWTIAPENGPSQLHPTMYRRALCHGTVPIHVSRISRRVERYCVLPHLCLLPRYDQFPFPRLAESASSRYRPYDGFASSSPSPRLSYLRMDITAVAPAQPRSQSGVDWGLLTPSIPPALVGNGRYRKRRYHPIDSSFSHRFFHHLEKNASRDVSCHNSASRRLVLSPAPFPPQGIDCVIPPPGAWVCTVLHHEWVQAPIPDGVTPSTPQ
jgi:hypothetical protein